MLSLRSGCLWAKAFLVWGCRKGAGAREFGNKNTVLLASDPAFEKLSRQCPGARDHHPVIGSITMNHKSYGRSAVAAAYPIKFCRAYASLAVSAAAAARAGVHKVGVVSLQTGGRSLEYLAGES
jgi:hypothetical protein